MMTTDYGVRILHAYGMFRVGQIIYPPGLLRSNLLSRGLVEVVKAPDGPQEPKPAEQKRKITHPVR